MGAEQSSSNGQLKLLKDQKWCNLGQRDDKIYGEVKVYQSVEDHYLQLAIVSRMCSTESEFNRLINKYHKMSELNEIPGMIKLYEIAHQKEDAFCSNMYKVNVAFEYHSSNLQRSLEERIISNSPFDTTEIIEFLQQMLITLSLLESKSYYHGDLRPQNILLCEGQYKITDTNSLDQYKKFIVGLEEHCYLPPELFTQMSLRTMRPVFGRRQADVFTLGLVTLCMGALTTTHSLYNFDCYQINQHALDNLFGNFSDRHGPQLTAFLRQFLLDAELRPSFEQLNQQLIIFKNDYQQPAPSSRRQQQPSPNHRYSNQSSRGASPQQYQYSSRKPPIDSSFLHKLEPTDQHILLNETGTNRKNWASEFLNDSDTVVHVPCNPGEDYLQMEGDFKVPEPKILTPLETTNIIDKRQPSLKKNSVNTSSQFGKLSIASSVSKAGSSQGAILKRPKSAFYKKENIRQKSTLPQNKWVR